MSFAIGLSIVGAAVGGKLATIYVFWVMLFLVAIAIPFTSIYFRSRFPNFLGGLLLGSIISIIALGTIIILMIVGPDAEVLPYFFLDFG